MGDLLDKAFETPAVILTDGNQVTGGLLTSTSDDAWIAEPDAPIGSVHYKTDGTRQTRIAFTGSGVADDFASENPLATGGGASVSFSWRFSTSTAEADPGNARLRFDNATPASVTALFVDDFDTAGIDVSGILNALPVGTRVYLQEQGVSGSFLIGTTTAITDNTGWFKIELTVTDSGTLPANNKIVGVLFFAGGGGAAVPGDQAVASVRRTTDQLFTGAWVDVELDDVIVENDATVVEHDAITDRITLKDPGLYWISYRVDAETDPILSANSHSFVDARVTVNDVAADLPGSLCSSTAWEDGSINGDGTQDAVLIGGFPYVAGASDFITLQIQQRVTDADAIVNAAGNRVMLSAVRMTGERGPQGVPGSGGSTIRVGKTYAIAGEIKVPVGETDFIVPFFVSLGAGQTADLVKARHQINAGTSVTCKLQKNAVDITGFTGISVTTTPADTDPTDVALADNDELALVVTAVAGTPQNMTFTIFIEHTG